MKNFDTVLDVQGARQIRVSAPPMMVREKVTVTVQAPAASFLLRDDEQWDWRDLRDYVASQIEKRFGPFPRNDSKEASIFKSFLSRYGKDAPMIARFAFEHCDGLWAGAPISVNRFCKGSDPFFGDRILQHVAR